MEEQESWEQGRSEPDSSDRSPCPAFVLVCPGRRQAEFRRVGMLNHAFASIRIYDL